MALSDRRRLNSSVPCPPTRPPYSRHADWDPSRPIGASLAIQYREAPTPPKKGGSCRNKAYRGWRGTPTEIKLDKPGGEWILFFEPASSLAREGPRATDCCAHTDMRSVWSALYRQGGAPTSHVLTCPRALEYDPCSEGSLEVQYASKRGADHGLTVQTGQGLLDTGVCW